MKELCIFTLGMISGGALLMFLALAYESAISDGSTTKNFHDFEEDEE